MRETSWVHFLRENDLKIILKHCNQKLYDPVLEIGCGDGHITSILKTIFNNVTPLDPNPRDKIKDVVVCSAEKMPFEDKSFKTIYSSNVLEHIEDINAGLSEMNRVLDDDGIMIHSIPTVSWKIFQLILHPLYLARLIINRSKNNVAKKNDNMRKNKRKISPKLISKLIAPVHGTSKNSFDELFYFKKSNWVKIFNSNNFKIIRTKPLFFHTAHRLFPNKLLFLRLILSKIGLASVRVYYIKNIS